MPLFTPDGRVLAGVGNGVVSLAGVVLREHAGGWAHDGTRALGPALVDAARDKWAIVDEHGHQVDPQGANTFFAGGGQWAAWLDREGVRGTNPILPLPKAGLIAVTRHGWLVIKPDYHAMGGWEAYDPHGDLMLEGDERVWAAEDGFVLTDGHVPAGMLVYRVCRLDGGQPYATAYLHGKTVLWKVGTEMCCVLNTTEDAYHPDVLGREGRLHVCWSRREGERPEDIVVTSVSPDATWQTLDSLVEAPPPIDPPPPPIDPPPPPIKPEALKMTSIVLDPIRAVTITEVPHPDGHGLVALRDTTTLQYLTVEPGGLVRWSAQAGAWEQFYPGVAYTAVREHGAVWVIQKGGTWT